MVIGLPINKKYGQTTTLKGEYSKLPEWLVTGVRLEAEVRLALYVSCDVVGLTSCMIQGKKKRNKDNAGKKAHVENPNQTKHQTYSTKPKCGTHKLKKMLRWTLWEERKVSHYIYILDPMSARKCLMFNWHTLYWFFIFFYMNIVHLTLGSFRINYFKKTIQW